MISQDAKPEGKKKKKKTSATAGTFPTWLNSVRPFGAQIYVLGTLKLTRGAKQNDPLLGPQI